MYSCPDSHTYTHPSQYQGSSHQLLGSKHIIPKAAGGLDFHGRDQLNRTVQPLGLKFMLSHWLRDQLVPPLFLLSIIGPQKWLNPMLSPTPTQVSQYPLGWVQDAHPNTLRVLIWMFLRGCLFLVSDTHPQRVRKGLHASAQPIRCPTTYTASSATAISLMTTEELQSWLWLIQAYYSAVGTNADFYIHMGQHLLIF